jgi:hypothetical protein
MVTSFPNIPTWERFISSRPSPVGSWKEKVIDEASLSDARSLSGLNSHRGAASGRHPTNTGLQHSSSNSIFGEVSLPFMSLCRWTPLIRMDWYPAVGAVRQLELNGPRRTELYFVMSV